MDARSAYFVARVQFHERHNPVPLRGTGLCLLPELKAARNLRVARPVLYLLTFGDFWGFVNFSDAVRTS